MKFVYEYRTSDNVPHRGTIAASTKEAAYDTLKAQGIKPGKVWEAPGFLNKVFGKGKRWIAIVLLTLVSVGLLCLLFKTSKQIAETNEQLAVNELESMCEDRAQLFGDPVVIRECEECSWTNVFAATFDVYLAQYAIPGRSVEPCVVAPLPTNEEATQLVEIGEKDLVEIAQMKRMVNGMKRELGEYLADGGTLASYMNRLNIRQRAERGVYETAQRQILRAKDYATWKEKNAELRAMGLPMVELPEPNEEK